VTSQGLAGCATVSEEKGEEKGNRGALDGNEYWPTGQPCRVEAEAWISEALSSGPSFTTN
jgi:hypothetical protein